MEVLDPQATKRIAELEVRLAAAKERLAKLERVGTAQTYHALFISKTVEGVVIKLPDGTRAVGPTLAEAIDAIKEKI